MTSLASKNGNAMEDLAAEDGRYSVDEIASRVEILKDAVHYILTKHLGLRNV